MHEPSLEALIAAQAAAWNQNDATAWSEPFAEDADFVNILGGVFSGRAAIEQQHARIFASIYAGSTSVVTIRRMLLLSADAALVHTDHAVSGYRGLPPGVASPADGVLRTRMKYIAERRGASWSITAAQNTATIAAHD